MTHLTLASASASRAALLTGAGLIFDKIPADLDEDALKDNALARALSPKAVALELARAKAVHVSLRQPGLVLGGDQVLQLEQDLISKSPDRAAARRLLQRMSGKTHYLHAAQALAENGAVIWSNVETAEMTVRSLSDETIDAYLDAAGDKILSSVGAYQLEGLGVNLFDSIRGDYFTVLGLPLLPLLAQLRHMKVIA
jgi:septum formation protein